MGRLEDLAAQYAANARYDLSQALDHITSLDEEGELGDHDLGRIADRYHLMTWWQKVTDLTHGSEDTVDGATAILTVRQRAHRYLLEVGARTHGSAFALAMAESRRTAAHTFLNATRQLADALTPPPPPGTHPAKQPAEHPTAHPAPAGPGPGPGAWSDPPVF
ncbi:hypothetical protein ACIBEJ_30495 [Nonomuraea sp. NPDC050790]|uniref:hypothetical protein n=1 Tax=Nonomuraea sp. NPDC050790 TaxID=3364371 RepID=UPI0037B10D5C